jgi:hypothetical protein
MSDGRAANQPPETRIEARPGQARLKGRCLSPRLTAWASEAGASWRDEHFDQGKSSSKLKKDFPAPTGRRRAHSHEKTLIFHLGFN